MYKVRFKIQFQRETEKPIPDAKYFDKKFNKLQSFKFDVDTQHFNFLSFCTSCCFMSIFA